MDKNTAAMTKIEELIALKKRYENELKMNAQAAMNEVFKNFFDDNPNVLAFYWTQYTPYFNDGEACEFSVGEFMFSTVDNLDVDVDEEIDDMNFHSTYAHKYSKNKDIQALAATAKNVSKFEQYIKTAGDDIFLACFGDHARVIATREGFSVDECEHD
jgi:hypothetical protein